MQTYSTRTILDESGLVIIARQVPNLYYQYRGQAGINPNIYIIIKNARVNVPESYIRYSYVVEGDFVAYAHKFVSAILEGLERPAAPRAANRPGLPGEPPAPDRLDAGLIIGVLMFYTDSQLNGGTGVSPVQTQDRTRAYKK